MISNNEIYTKVKDAVVAVNPKTFCSSVFTETPQSFPAAFIRPITSSERREFIELDFSDAHREVTFEAQIFSTKSSGASVEAHEILDAVKTAFKQMYFIVEMEQPIDNSDKTIYRIAARFRRVIGGGDKLNEGE